MEITKEGLEMILMIVQTFWDMLMALILTGTKVGVISAIGFAIIYFKRKPSRLK